MEKYWETIRRNVIPTSTSQQLESLKNLLNHFCGCDITFKSAKVSNGTLNYVVVMKPSPAASGRLHEEHASTAITSPLTTDRPKKTLLLMHGFGSGLGFFFNNYDDLTKSFDRVIAVDWLGMGGSSRQSLPSNSTDKSCFSSQTTPRFSVLEQVYNRTMVNKSERLPSTVAAVDFFVDSLEEMREQLVTEGTLDPNESLHLAGHSLGGYLAAQYALKHPDKINSLILISPVGIPNQPSKDTRTKSAQMSWGLYTAATAWAANITPQTIVRMAGPKGESLVRSVLDRRFGGRWSPLELDLISSYLYHISAAPALGEYSLNSLLEVVTSSDPSHSKAKPKPNSPDAPPSDKRFRIAAEHDGKPAEAISSTFIYAREPLVERLHELPKTLPVLVLFGDTDWLYNPIDIINRDVKNLREGKTLASSLKSNSATVPAEIMRSKIGIDITLQVIPDAGHHIYLDNAKGFTHSITFWLKQKGFR